jgi:predicted nucleotidyltransferase
MEGYSRIEGNEFLNYLVQEDRTNRLSFSQSLLSEASVPSRFQVYLFGSYLRRELYDDIDLILVYPIGTDQELVSSTLESIRQVFKERASQLDLTVCSEVEYTTMKFEDDNRTRIR